MSVYITYYPTRYNKNDFIANLQSIKDVGFDGVLIPATRQPEEFLKYHYKHEFLPINRMIGYASDMGLKTGVIIDTFQSPQLWQSGRFSSPINVNGVDILSNPEYYPVCPNNPDGQDRFYNLLEKMERIAKPDLFYLNYMRFPFDWKNEELDVQHHIPPFCYCPFCIGEFSALVGEIVDGVPDIVDFLPDWLGWRTTSVLNHFFTAKNFLAPIAKMIIATPPLALIDLPFTTGQLPVAYASEGVFVSPLLFHAKKDKGLDWVQDMLSQYQYDINKDYINPTFEISTADEFTKCLKMQNEYDDIFFNDWDLYKERF